MRARLFAALGLALSAVILLAAAPASASGPSDNGADQCACHGDTAVDWGVYWVRGPGNSMRTFRANWCFVLEMFFGIPLEDCTTGLFHRYIESGRLGLADPDTGEVHYVDHPSNPPGSPPGQDKQG